MLTFKSVQLTSLNTNYFTKNTYKQIDGKPSKIGPCVRYTNCFVCLSTQQFSEISSGRFRKPCLKKSQIPLTASLTQYGFFKPIVTDYNANW